MYRLLRGGGRVLADYCLRPVWRALATFGAIYVGPEAIKAVGAPGYASRSANRLTRYAQRRLLVLPPGIGGPPPAHPECLREDVPLSAEELLLASELWPAYEPRAHDGG